MIRLCNSETASSKTKEVKKMVLEKRIEKWQELCDAQSENWLHNIMPNLTQWTKRTHGMSKYHMTQIFSGHGNFQSYLKRIGKYTMDECGYCGEQDPPEPSYCTAKRDGDAMGGSTKMHPKKAG